MQWIANWHNPWAIGWNLAGSAVTVMAVVGLAQTPVEQFAYGKRSRFWRIVTAVGLWFSIAGFVIPIGALWQLNNPPLRRPELS